MPGQQRWRQDGRERAGQQINGNILNASEQLKHLVSQSPVSLTPSLNNKKRRNRRSATTTANSNEKNATLAAFGHCASNLIAATSNQSQQTTTTTLPLLTANQFRTDSGGLQGAPGLKLALPLQAVLPSEVSAVLTTVNGTTQESSKSAPTPAKRSSSGSASPKKQQKEQTNT